MTTPFTVLAIPGSLRADSLNRALLTALAASPPDGVRIEVFEGLGDVPHYDGDLDTDTAPPAVARLRERIGGADALLIATPEYNSSLPGVLKNALDWASRPHGTSALNGTPTAVVGVSPSAFGAVWAAAETRKVLAASGARVLDTELGVPHAHTLLDADGRFVDTDTLARMAGLVNELRHMPVPAGVA